MYVIQEQIKLKRLMLKFKKMKKILEIVFKRFWVNFVLMMAIAILDLIGLSSKISLGLGFIIAFLYLFSFIIYNMTKKDSEK